MKDALTIITRTPAEYAHLLESQKKYNREHIRQRFIYTETGEVRMAYPGEAYVNDYYKDDGIQTARYNTSDKVRIFSKVAEIVEVG